MSTWMEDLRHGLRRLRRSPGFAATALLTLALGIGATTAIFTLIYQVILKSMPIEHPEQLYKVGKEIECCVDGGLQGDWRIFSYDLYKTFREGDRIKVAGFEGKVRAIDLRYTLLDTETETVFLPNQLLFNNAVVVVNGARAVTDVPV